MPTGLQQPSPVFQSEGPEPQSSMNGSPNSSHGAWSLTALSALIAVAVAACGGSGAKPSGSTTPYGPRSSPIAMSRCFRDNGVSGFPDPRSGPDGGGVGFPGGFIVTGSGSLVVMGIPFAGPAVKHAEQVCKEFLPPSGGPPQISQSQKNPAIANADCMRRNGVPNFPDPTFSGNRFNAGLGHLNPSSPAFKHAASVCGGGRILNFSG